MCRLFSKNPQTFQALRSDKMPSSRRLSLLMQGRLSDSADSTISEKRFSSSCSQLTWLGEHGKSPTPIQKHHRYLLNDLLKKS